MKKQLNMENLGVLAAALISAALITGCSGNAAQNGNSDITSDAPSGNEAESQEQTETVQESEKTSGENGEKLKVMASFYPMYDFAVKIGGEKAEVVDMVPAGTEPHDWEPAASDMKNLEEADLFVYSGAGMEHWVDTVLGSLENQKLVTVEADSAS